MDSLRGWIFCIVTLAFIGSIGLAALAPNDPDSPNLPPKVQAVVFTTDGCFPCEKMKQEIKENLPHWKVGKWNDDYAAWNHLNYDDTNARKYRIALFPTTILFRNGKEVKRHKGYWNWEDLAGEVKKAER